MKMQVLFRAVFCTLIATIVALPISYLTANMVLAMFNNNVIAVIAALAIYVIVYSFTRNFCEGIAGKKK